MRGSGRIQEAGEPRRSSYAAEPQGGMPAESLPAASRLRLRLRLRLPGRIERRVASTGTGDSHAVPPPGGGADAHDGVPATAVGIQAAWAKSRA